MRNPFIDAANPSESPSGNLETMASKAKRSTKKKGKPAEDAAARIRKANAPAELSAKWHPFYEGKIEIGLKAPVRTFDDFAIWYTPGVAEPCMEIAKEPEAVYRLTNKWNNVAIVTDGSRVLG